MQHKPDKLMILIIVFVLIIFGTVSMFWGVNGLSRNMKVIKISITLMDVKAGLKPIQTEMLSTTDSNEIKEVLNILAKPIFYKALPDLGGVPANSNDRLELIITLQSDNNELLEYFVTSEGDMKIERFNERWSSKNVNILISRNIEWFKQLQELYKSKEKNENWFNQ